MSSPLALLFQANETKSEILETGCARGVASERRSPPQAKSQPLQRFVWISARETEFQQVRQDTARQRARILKPGRGSALEQAGRKPKKTFNTSDPPRKLVAMKHFGGPGIVIGHENYRNHKNVVGKKQKCHRRRTLHQLLQLILRTTRTMRVVSWVDACPNGLAKSVAKPGQEGGECKTKHLHRARLISGERSAGMRSAKKDKGMTQPAATFQMSILEVGPH